VSADEMMDTKLRVNFDQLMSAAAAGGATSATTFVSQSVVNDSFSGDAKVCRQLGHYFRNSNCRVLQHTSQDTQAGDGEKRRLVDELERSKAENAKLLRTNKDLMVRSAAFVYFNVCNFDSLTSFIYCFMIIVSIDAFGSWWW
jgi:uncharacterized protein (DUF1778 family)